ncbi:MAG: ABC transporter ATP-binding protein/permease [Ruminococcus sp.]|nr:ABC transporter ATP-binding protein/permease [Ruminococcus sp.]
MIKDITYAVKYVIRLTPVLAITDILLSIVLAILTPVQIKITELCLDSVTEYFAGAVAISSVIMWIAGLVVLLILQAIFKHLADLTYIELKREVSHKLSAKIIEKLQVIKYSNFENEQFYDTLNRIHENPADKVSGLFYSFIMVISYTVELICVAGLLITISPVFGVLYAVILIYVVTMNFLSMYKMNNMFYEMSSAERRLDYLEKIVTDKSSLYEIQVYGAKEMIMSKIHAENRRVFSQRLKTTISAQKYCFLSSIGTTLWIVSLFAFLMMNISSGVASASLMVALLSMVGRILSSTDSVSYEISNLAQNSLASKCLREFFSLENESITDDSRLESDIIHTITFENVSFRYSENSANVLENISFTMRSDENIAVVGYNGAGKTTLILLLCGLLEPTEGRILIDGVSLSDIPKAELTKLFAVVFQDYGRYQVSVRENVALGSLIELENDVEICKSLKMADAEADFPVLDQMIGRLYESGTDLSGGQWQKLAIARAFFSNRDFFIFDEPTASLDAEAENILYKNLKSRFSHKGCIFISHRLPGAIMSNRILVIDNHHLAESGTHEELLLKNGIYAEMYHAQADSYLEGGTRS